MSATSPANVPAQSESKTARKKKVKTNAPDAEVVPASRSSSNGAKETQSGADGNSNGVEGAQESAYIKELNKNLRNVKKKLSATQKVDSIIAENPGKSLDELLASRKINVDQKIQAEKKPALQASLIQIEEQIENYKKFDEDYNNRFSAEKTILETSHRQELEKAKEAALTEAETKSKKEIKDSLLVLSRFLRAAAARRQDGDESDEGKAFEGALLLVYGGDIGAVGAMEKLIEGSDEDCPTVHGAPSGFTYKQVRDSSTEHAPSTYAAEEAWVEEVAQSEPTHSAAQQPSGEIGSDPTVLHAGLTEIDAEQNQPKDEGASSHIETPTVPDASNIDPSAANAAAEANWDAKMSASAASGPDGWVEIPRDPAETDTGITATPAANPSTQSWAEDVPQQPAATKAATNGSEGFHEVHHNRGRGRGGQQGDYRGGNRGRGGFRGDRGGEGGYRGRGGFRGDRGGDNPYRGRGRGGPRGGQRGRGDAAPQ